MWSTGEIIHEKKSSINLDFLQGYCLHHETNTIFVLYCFIIYGSTIYISLCDFFYFDMDYVRNTKRMRCFFHKQTISDFIAFCRNIVFCLKGCIMITCDDFISRLLLCLQQIVEILWLCLNRCMCISRHGLINRPLLSLCLNARISRLWLKGFIRISRHGLISIIFPTL